MCVGLYVTHTLSLRSCKLLLLMCGLYLNGMWTILAQATAISLEVNCFICVAGGWTGILRWVRRTKTEWLGTKFEKFLVGRLGEKGEQRGGAVVQEREESSVAKQWRRKQWDKGARGESPTPCGCWCAYCRKAVGAPPSRNVCGCCLKKEPYGRCHCCGVAAEELGNQHWWQKEGLVRRTAVDATGSKEQYRTGSEVER